MRELVREGERRNQVCIGCCKFREPRDRRILKPTRDIPDELFFVLFISRRLAASRSLTLVVKVKKKDRAGRERERERPRRPGSPEANGERSMCAREKFLRLNWRGSALGSLYTYSRRACVPVSMYGRKNRQFSNPRKKNLFILQFFKHSNNPQNHKKLFSEKFVIHQYVSFENSPRASSLIRQ